MAVITQYDPADPHAPRYRGWGDKEARPVDRIVTGFGGPVRIMRPVGTPKPREECQPFAFTFAKPEGYRAVDSVKGQEKFLKGLEKLTKAQARKDAARAKAAAKRPRPETPRD